MTYGVDISIDVSKLDKEKFIKGEKGTYCNLTVFLDPDNPDQYGKHGGVKQALTKAEKEAGKNPKDQPYIGNAKVFWKGDTPQAAPTQAAPAQDDPFDSDIPFS